MNFEVYKQTAGYIGQLASKDIFTGVISSIGVGTVLDVFDKKYRISAISVTKEGDIRLFVRGLCNPDLAKQFTS